MPCFLRTKTMEYAVAQQLQTWAHRRPEFLSLWSVGEIPALGVETFLMANGKYVRFVLQGVFFQMASFTVCGVGRWREVGFPQSTFWSLSSITGFRSGPGAEETRLSRCPCLLGFISGGIPFKVLPKP